MSISPATGVPHGKEHTHGTQTSLRPHHAGRRSGTSTSASAGGEFAKALELVTSKRRNAILAKVMEQTRQAIVYGVRPARTFEQAAAKFVLENQHKRSHRRRCYAVSRSDALDRQRATRQAPYWHAPAVDRKRRQRGRSRGTINHGLKVVRRILNLAASEWSDEQGTDLAPGARRRSNCFPTNTSVRPIHSAGMSKQRLFGRSARASCADGAFCGEHRLPGCRNVQSALGVGSGRARAWNKRVHRSGLAGEEWRRSSGRPQSDGHGPSIESRRGINCEHVFTYEGRPVVRMMTPAWRRARARAGLPQVRVHDLKHTFGRRLRAAGVSLRGSARPVGTPIGPGLPPTTRRLNCPALLEAADRVAGRQGQEPQLVVLRGVLGRNSRKTPARHRQGAARHLKVVEINGGRSRTRTCDPLIKSQLLYQLSYAPRPPKTGLR